MTSKRIYYLMVGVLGLLVVGIIASAYVASGMLQKQSNRLVDYKLQNQVLSAEQVGLMKAKKDIASYSSLGKIAQTIVPQDKDQAKAVREIVKIAAASGIKPSSITFPASTLGGTTTASGTTMPAASAQQSLSQLLPVKGIPGVYNLQITIQQDAASPVPYSQFIDFLGRLEQNRRTAQVVGIVLQPSPLDRNLVSFTLTLEEFIKP